MSLGLSLSSAEYKSGISFSNRFCRLVITVKTVGLLFFVVCTFFMSFYIWICTRALIRFTSFRVLSFGLTIVKIILSEFRPLDAFRDLYC
jgi:hypothetical protein